MAEIITAVTTGFTTITADVTSMLAVAVPAALAVLGIIIAVKVGIRSFRRLMGG